MTRKYTGETIAVMGIVASMIREAALEKGIDVELPEEAFRQDGRLSHFFLDVPVADQICRVVIQPPVAVRRNYD